MTERKVYNSWAFTQNEGEKAQINREIYNELTSKYKVYRSSNIDLRSVEKFDEYDVAICRYPKYLSSEYQVIKNEPNLSVDELLLICDQGNLCFGGKSLSANRLLVWED